MCEKTTSDKLVMLVALVFENVNRFHYNLLFLFKISLKFIPQRISLVVQWSILCTSTAGGTSSVPDQGTKIPQAVRCGQKVKIFFNK